jgi:hypothetical protein
MTENLISSKKHWNHELRWNYGDSLLNPKT